LVGPGGIVWFQAGRGAIHHEIPAEADHELHGAQIFVKLSARNKFIVPRTFWFDASEVPEWRNEDGDRVRVAVGSFQGVSSPLTPAEPLDLLDVGLRQGISFDLPNAHNARVYVLNGGIRVRADGREERVRGEQALALCGSGGRVTFEASDRARFLIISGVEIREPVVVEGPFIMNDRSQIEAAAARYRAGEMGYLAPLAES
jgi:redox-sensitive bicupin YhaK (pirin superfamily)